MPSPYDAYPPIEHVRVAEGKRTRVEIKKEGEEIGVRVVPAPEVESPRKEAGL
jgi:hypothetical protein